MPSRLSMDEAQPLLADAEQAHRQDLGQDQLCAQNPYAHLPVYATIHRVRREVIASLDDFYSLDQLRGPRINVSVVRPLVNRLWDIKDVSMVYCLLVNKLQFLREQAYQGHQTINTTRAQLCELVALKILRRFDEENPGNNGLLVLSNIMCAGFGAFQNAPAEVIRECGYSIDWTAQKQGGSGRKSTVLEIAIISESKMLISSPACQRVMEAIYVGRVVYTPSSFIDILPDHYKHKPITLYRPECAPILDQYRLMVPRTRNILDICQFIMLLVLYVLVMRHRDYEAFTTYELIFCIYALGWVLDELASILEHGWHCYTQNLWSFLDTIFAVIYLVYFVLRIHSLATGDVARSAAPALDILSAAAPVLIPRLAFNLMSENMLFVSLRAMMADFTVLTLLAVWCFAGFLLSMAWLSGDNQDSITISKWMLWVWFGLDGTGIDMSVNFHWLIGPILMVTFAFLGNTLFLTILVSMLSSTFAKIADNATAEIQFRRAVLTFEGVKSDAIFAYQPPFNVLALCLILPLKLVVSPRWFHKVNVAVIRTLNAPLLLAITTYERRHLWAENDQIPDRTSARRGISISTWLWGLMSFWDFSRFAVHGDIQDVFNFDPPRTVIEDIPETEDTKADHGRPRPISNGGPSINPTEGIAKPSKRKHSFGTVAGLAEHLTDFFHEHGGGDISERLDAVEAATGRIEAILHQISQNMGDNGSDDVAHAIGHE
ncbi:MAG: hypothetical protein Q9163_002568 [Psora crenata]